MPRVVGPTSAGSPIDVSVSGRSSHVVAYKLWWRDATTDWTVIAEGSTGDQQPDHVERPFTAGAQLFHWLGVSGAPDTSYQAVITLSQAGAPLPNGLVDVSGQTNEKGVDTQQDWASFV